MRMHAWVKAASSWSGWKRSGSAAIPDLLHPRAFQPLSVQYLLPFPSCEAVLTPGRSRAAVGLGGEGFAGHTEGVPPPLL